MDCISHYSKCNLYFAGYYLYFPPPERTCINRSLAWTCLRIQTPHTSTRSLLRRATIQALTCGFAMAIFTTFMSASIFIVWNVFRLLFAILGRIYSLTLLITVMLLKVMNRSDPSSSRINGNSDSTTLGPICFKHTLDTEVSKRQPSSNETENSRHLHPHFATVSNDQPFIHTV
ncbi:uncharacterized protein EV420DRAFT_412015 [Desarmillaria tabescens]|uniref:Uncharacterized protein n=1 Tax=Armillaria tabescens TaxID=1929756 RepID=A0AA39KE21_ARMTA|nr:uncharacterized protein EV420DRAFT_412015 [Desarmillaria tabescens]KAK0458079.1 hypothetical protein EV420DRAFT_412015 [Desarmillaria tabescens]